MAYTTGGLIEVSDFNNLVENMRSQWGTGTGANGLGQSTTAITDLPGGQTITATQWTGLLQTINSCLTHEGQTAVTPAAVTAGETVTAYTSITNGITTAYNNSGSTSLALNASSAYSASTSTAWGSASPHTLVTTHTVTFASSDAARFFFNAGGNLAVTFSRTGGSATTINSEWSGLCDDCGTVRIGHRNTTKAGGTGTPSNIKNANNGGYWNLTTSNVEQFRQYDGAAAYSNNFIKIDAKWGGTLSNGGYDTVIIETSFNNEIGGQTVDGNTSSSVVINSPSTTYLTNTWGSPTVGAVVTSQSGTGTSGPVGYGFYQTIAANTQNYNLKAAAIAAGWDQVLPLTAKIIINPGVYVGASSTGNYAFQTGSGFPVGTTLAIDNNGTIIGAGGQGGNSSHFNNCGALTAGYAGGHALYVAHATTVTNYGWLYGGGGGGGGGGSGSWSFGYNQSCGGDGGGGGGGAGYNPGPGGATVGYGGSSGVAGSTLTGGAGGYFYSSTTGCPSNGQAGGRGGDAGTAGYAGAGGNICGGAGGGAAGNAIVGNANITWVTGDTRRTGGVS